MINLLPSRGSPCTRPDFFRVGIRAVARKEVPYLAPFTLNVLVASCKHEVSHKPIVFALPGHITRRIVRRAERSRATSQGLLPLSLSRCSLVLSAPTPCSENATRERLTPQDAGLSCIEFTDAPQSEQKWSLVNHSCSRKHSRNFPLVFFCFVSSGGSSKRDTQVLPAQSSGSCKSRNQPGPAGHRAGQRGGVVMNG